MHHLKHSDAESPRPTRRISRDPRHTVAQIHLFATLKASLNHTAAWPGRRPRNAPLHLRMSPKALPAEGRAGSP